MGVDPIQRSLDFILDVFWIPEEALALLPGEQRRKKMVIITESGRSMSLELIRHFEGCRLVAYQDQVGVWTVGYGCTGKGIGPGTTWTQEQAEEELSRRVEKFISTLLPAITQQPTDHQAAALVSLCYNIGSDAILHSTLLKDFNAGDIAKTAVAFLAWDHAGGKVDPGLLKRRQREQEFFLTED